MGLYLGQGYLDADLGAGGGSVEAHHGRMGGYCGWHENGFYIQGSSGFGITEYDTQRQIRFMGETASGETQGVHFSGRGRAGVDFQTRDWVWGPFLQMDYDKNWIESFSEKGAAARLKIDSQSSDSLESAVGLRVVRPFQALGYRWIPEMHLLGSYQWFKPNRIGARFEAGGDHFEIQPEGDSREGILPGTSISLLLSDDTSIQMGYDARVTIRSESHMFNLGWKSSF